MPPNHEREVTETLERVTARFREDLPSRLDATRQSIGEWERTGHPREVLRHLHSLAGACGIFGFPSLAEEVRAIHDSIRAGASVEDARAELARLSAENPA